MHMQNVHGSTGFSVAKTKEGILKKGPKTVSFKGSKKEPIVAVIKSLVEEDLSHVHLNKNPFHKQQKDTTQMSAKLVK